MNLPPLAVAGTVCAVACSGVTYRIRHEGSERGRGPTPSGGRGSGPSRSSRSEQALATVLTLLVVLSMVASPAAAGLGSGAGSGGAETAPVGGGSADGTDPTARPEGPSPTAPGDRSTRTGRVGAPSPSAGVDVAATTGDRGNTGSQPWYFYAKGVNTANGNLFRSAEDVSIPARGGDLTFVRSYNSHASTEHGPLGFGWTHNYAMRLEEQPDGSVVLVDADGARHRFVESGGSYEAPPGVRSRLDERAGGYDLRLIDGRHLRFDGSGLLRWIEDRNGNRITLEYASGRLTAVRGASGTALTFEYDDGGRIAEVTGPLNRTVEYDYSTGDLVEVTGKAGDTTRYSYYENHKLRQAIDRHGVRTIYRYDETTGRAVFAGSGTTVSTCRRTGVEIEYDLANDTVELLNRGSGNRTTVTLNGAGNPVRREGELGPVEMAWDDRMNLLEVTNATGTHTFAYDGYGNRVEWTGPDGETVESAWETVDTADAYFSVLRERTDARGRTTTYRHDEDGNRIEVIGPEGRTVRRTYDDHGDVRSRVDPLGRVTRYTHDDRGLRTAVIAPDGTARNFSYDAAGRRVSETDARGNTYRFDYTARDDVDRVVDPLGNELDYVYDADGSLLRIERSVGEGGTVSSVTPRTGSNRSGAYDVTYTDRSITYTADEYTLTRRFDEEYTLQSETVDFGSFERSLEYTYDEEGRLVETTTENGTWRYEYDALDRTTNVTGPDGTWVSYGYDDGDRVTSATYSNGVTTTYEYDVRDRVTRVRVVDENGTVVLDESYTYGPRGNRLTTTDGDGNVTRYGYDELGRLVNVTYPSGKRVSYTYDAIGNRLSRSVNGTETVDYEYDADGRLVRAGATTYEYDERGRLVATEDGSGRTEYGYGPDGRLETVTTPDGETVEYAHLPDGERVKKSVGGDATYYLYGDFELLATFDERGSIQRRYLQGPDIDTPVALLAENGTYFYHLDRSNDVRALTDANGTVANRYEYAPFGTLRTERESVENAFRFAARRFDAETGHYYNRLRYYDPEIGRFTRRDPAGTVAGINPYEYAESNPVRYTDPFGMATWRGGIGGISASGPGGNLGFSKTSKASGDLSNRHTWQNCGIEVQLTEYGLFAEGSLGSASLRSAPLVMSGPECGEDLPGYTFTCAGVGTKLGLGGKADVKAFACGGAEGVGGGLDAGVGVDAGGGVSMTFLIRGEILSSDCSCPLADKNAPESCRCDGDDEPPDDPPGSDHPDDNHDPSVLSFDRTVERSSVPAYDGYTPDVAVLDRGFDEEMAYFLDAVNESGFDTVEIDTTNGTLARYDVLVVPTGGLMGLASFPPLERKLDRFVDRGGTLIVMPQQRGYQYGPVPGELRGYGWVEDQSCQFRSVGIDEYCPIVASQSDDVADINVDGYFTDYPDDAEVVLTRAKNGEPSMLKYGHGDGTVIATTAYTDWASGHHAWNQEGRDVLRDAVTWARGPRNLTTYAPGETVTVDLDATSYVDLRADRVEVRLYRPEAVFRESCAPDCEGFRVYDPERVPPLTANASTGLSALATRSLRANVTVPRSAQTGIWEVGYALYNDSHGEVQAVRETEQVAVSTFEPSSGGYQRFDSEIKLSLASDAENYARGSNATFAITARNEGDESETVTLWWAFPHNHRGPEDDALYGASTTRPAVQNSPLNRTLTVPAGEERTVTYRVPVSASFDRLWLQAHRGANRSGEYLGRTSRGFFTFRPGVDVNVSTDEDRYAVGANATVAAELRGEGVGNATVETVVLAPDNTLVDRRVETVSVGANRTTLARTVGLPTTPKTGHYVVTTEVRDGDGERVGYDSTAFEVPYEVRVAPTLPATVRETTRVEFAVENLGDSAVTNASLDAALVDPSGATVWNDSARVDVAGEDTERIDFEDVPVGEPQFGTYELRYVLEFGSNRLVQTSRLSSSVLVTGGFAEPRYRQRETATLTATLRNDGRFPVDSNVTLSVPDAGVVETRPLSLDPGERANRSYDIGLPADISAGTHEAVVTVGSTNPVTRTFDFAVPESDLRIGVERAGIVPGGDADVTVRNVGGVDTDADCPVEFIDPLGRSLPGTDIGETVRAGGNATTTLAVPEQAVSGRYFVTVSCTNGNTGETEEVMETVEVDGLSAGIGLSTDEEVYRPDENVTVTVDLENDGDAIENGTLHVEITDPSVAADGTSAGSDTTAGTSGSTTADRTVSSDVDSDDGSTPASGPTTAGTGSETDETTADGVGSVDTLATADRRAAGTYDSGGGTDALDGDRDTGSRSTAVGGASVGTAAREIDGATVWEDETVVLDESLVINGSGSLTMRNATLVFDLEDGGEFGIEVRDNGSLSVLQGSVIVSDSYHDYTFEVYGGTGFEVRDSTIRNVQQEPNSWDSDPNAVQRDAIGIATDGVVIENATIEGSGGAALAFHGADDARVIDSTFRNNGDAVLVNASADVTVAGNTFDDNFEGVVVRDVSGSEVRNNDFTNASSGWAVRLDNASATRVRDNRIGDRPGVELEEGSTDGTVTNNTIVSSFGSEDGVAVHRGANGTTVRGNDITGPTDGISVRANRTTVSDNVVRSAERFGIHVTAGNATLSNNAVSNGEIVGIYLRRAENATLRGNAMDSFHVDGSETTPLPLDNARNQVATVPDRRYYIHDIDTSNTVDGGPLKYRLDGTGGTVRPDGGAVWLVNATGVTVTGEGTVGVARSTGVELRDLNASTGTYVGAFVGHSNRTTLSNVTATDDGYGVVLFGATEGANATDTVVERTDVSNNGESGVVARAVADTVIRDTVARNNTHGLDVRRGRNVTVVGATVTGTRPYGGGSGIDMGYTPNSTVVDNHVRNFSEGIRLWNSEYGRETGNVTVSGNTVVGSRDTGISVTSAEASTVSNNVVRREDGYGATGISVWGENVSVVENDISGHGDGISISSDRGGTVRRNDVTNNTNTGIDVDGTGSVIEDNTGSGNEIGIRIGRNADDQILLDNDVSGTYLSLLIDQSRNATLRRNVLDGGIDITEDIYGEGPAYFEHDIDTSNTIDGDPLAYRSNETDTEVPAGAAQVWIANSTNVTAHGADRARVVYSESSTVRNVTASGEYDGVDVLKSTNTTVRNATVRGSSEPADAYCDGCGWGISVRASSGTRLVDVTSAGNQKHGVRVVDAADTAFENVTVATNEDDGLRVDTLDGGELSNVTAVNNGGAGLHFEETTNTTLAHASVRNHSYSGVEFDRLDHAGRQANNRVEDLVIGNHTGTALYFNSDGNVLSNVTVTGTEGGDFYSPNRVIQLGGDGNHLSNVTASDNGNWSYGIEISGENNTVTDSRFAENLYGVGITFGRNNTVNGTYIVDNRGSGVRLQSAQDNLLYNNYIDNPEGDEARETDGDYNDDPSEDNAWNVTKRPADGTNIVGGEFIAGNYWGSYAGDDTDGDGIGDTDLPYDVAGELNVGDYRPLVGNDSGGRVVWSTNRSVDVESGTTETITVEVPASWLGGDGKRKLGATLTSSSDQTVAVEDPPFYVFESNTTLTMEPDATIYRTDETAAVSGVLTNDGSAERSYDLSVAKNGTEIHGESVTLAPGETHSYTVNTTADGPFRLTASAGEVTVEEAVEVAEPRVEATVSSPMRVDRGPFGIGIELENTGRVETDLTVGLAPGNDTWSVALAPGETRLLRANRTVRSDTIYTVDISGGVDRSLTAGVAFAENATVETSPADVYAPGTVEVPYTVENTDELPTEFIATFAVDGRTRERAIYLPVDSNTSGSVVFDLPAGTHTLAVDWPFGNATRTLTVAEPDQIELNATTPATPTNGTLRTTIDLENVGPNAVNGTLRADSSVVDASRGFDLAGGENTTVTLALDVPEGTTPGRYDLTVSAESGGDALAEETATYETAGPVFELVAEPDLGTYGLGETVRVNATVANTGTAGGQVALNATAPGIAESAETAWLGAGERRSLTTTVRLPDDLEAGTYDLFYGLDGADRRTSIAVEGAKVDVEASLDEPGYTANDTATLTLNVTNERDIDLSPFVRVAFNDNETVRSFELNGSETETVRARVPVEFGGDDKIFYGVYADTGRSLYISGVYPHRARPNVTVSTDEQIYEPGETATVTVETDREGEVRLSAPGGVGWRRTVNGTAETSFEVPPLGSGTYYVHYSFDNESYSYPFDVDGYGVQVRDATLDQARYDPGDTLGLSLELVPTRNVSTTLTATVLDTNGTAVAETESAADLTTGRNEVTLATALPAGANGPYLVRYTIDGHVESRAVIATQGVKYFEVEGTEPNATNQVPTPVTGVSPTEPTAGETVTFDASASRDPDGTVAAYEWDFDGDGVYDDTGVRTTHTFAAAGEYAVTLRVTDDDGATNTTTETVRVAAPTATPTPSPGDGDDAGGGGQPGAAPGGEVEVTGATLLNDSVVAGSPVVVRVDLRNLDPAAGRLALTLTANGSSVTERTVEVEAASERSVDLRGMFPSAGTYALAVNGESVGTVTVAAPTPTATRAPTPTATPTPTAIRTPTAGPPTATSTGTGTPTDPSPSSPTSGDGPGFGPLAALLALLACLALPRVARLRRR